MEIVEQGVFLMLCDFTCNYCSQQQQKSKKKKAKQNKNKQTKKPPLICHLKFTKNLSHPDI